MFSSLLPSIWMRVLSVLYKDTCACCIALCAVLLALASRDTYSQVYPAPSMTYPASGSTVLQSGQNPCFSWTPVNENSSAASVQSVTTTFIYDDLGRVKTATYPNSIKNTYYYDAADNRAKKEAASN
ncbi:RHS repeat domain-containing protein [Cellvibrio mixtus]|uniref:RHS repeat domain-containing protein n=1 Tax=Cellvibrio mixtus TaxID=39650 RepID=UPI001269E9ED|nr:RHS repeat domain-containing protein [Cellvibrio mixtus]